MNSLLWFLADATDTGATKLTGDVNNLWNNTIQPIFSTVLWILTGLLAMFLVIKAVLTAMAVMKAADEPQVRQEKLNGFKYLAIALVVAIVVLTFANVLMSTLTSRAKVETITAGQGSSFLF